MGRETVDVGMMMAFTSYGWENCPDARAWDEEIRLARLAADLGFDCLWSAEHHFNDYSFVPDNLQLMTYLTALCPNIDLGTAAVIVPWHDPLRVAENAAVLRSEEHTSELQSPCNLVCRLLLEKKKKKKSKLFKEKKKKQKKKKQK